MCQLQGVNNVLTAFLQRPHDVPIASLLRHWRFYGAQAIAAACSWRAHGAHTAFSRRAHSVPTEIIAFKVCFTYLYILNNPILRTQRSTFTLISTDLQHIQQHTYTKQYTLNSFYYDVNQQFSFIYVEQLIVEIKDKLQSSLKCCQFNAFIAINRFYILNTLYDYLYYYQYALQTSTPNAY